MYTLRLVLATVKEMASERSMFTEPAEPGLVTELIFKPMVLGRVMPTNELVSVTEPPSAGTLLKLYVSRVSPLAVFTTSSPMLKSTGQSLSNVMAMVPCENEAVLKELIVPAL